LRRMDRSDLIGSGASFLVPGESRREKEIKKRETKRVKPQPRSNRSAPRRR